METLATTEAFRPNSGYFGCLLGPVAVVVGKIVTGEDSERKPTTEVSSGDAQDSASSWH